MRHDPPKPTIIEDWWLRKELLDHQTHISQSNTLEAKLFKETIPNQTDKNLKKWSKSLVVPSKRRQNFRDIKLHNLPSKILHLLENFYLTWQKNRTNGGRGVQDTKKKK